MDLAYLRTFLAVVEEGSFNRAALRLGISQPTLTRQMQALEQYIDGRLFDRGPTGVKLTDAGHVLVQHAQGILTLSDRALAETRRLAHGQRDELRIGYLLSAGQDFIDPALLALRQAHPEVTARLIELSPAEQISSLRRGELDVAVVGQEGSVLRKDFYTLNLVTYPAVAALPADHALAGKTEIALRELREELFVMCPDNQMPGRNEWISAQCRRAGFRPRFGPLGEGITHLLSLVVSSPAVALVPAYLRTYQHPGVRFVSLSDARPSWNMLVVWHRGRHSAPLKVFLDALRQASHSRKEV
jgi:DNA-binding transcriptional LysR family regulator